ncbi:LamG-like jellyroll fold domain-containing protein, partial [Thiolapillus sp.]|uniref:LamG-like jellyroll fold domain-containing protein n=1 Tax=Thiolapillus sp. TaxID=2017437 RepID=UPI003AF9AA1E
IEQGAGNADDPTRKPKTEVKINTADPLARGLTYYTLDFKKELVNNYDMPHEGSDIVWDATTKNVKFTSDDTRNRHNHIRLGAGVDDGDDIDQAITVIFKFKQPDSTGTPSTVFCNADSFSGPCTYIDLPNDLATSIPHKRYWAWAPSEMTNHEIMDDTLSGWHTYALTRGDDINNVLDMYLDGSNIQSDGNVRVRGHTNSFFRIGGFSRSSRWKTFIGEMEYFAVWNRQLTATEIATFTAKPYLIVGNQRNVIKPMEYQAVDESKEFAKHLIYYTCSWVDDIATRRPIYPESSPAAQKVQIDPDTDNLIFDGNYPEKQEVNLGGPDILSPDSFTVSIKIRMHSNASSKTLLHAIWGFPSRNGQEVQAWITGTKSGGYSVVFTIGPYSVTASADWSSLSDFKTWSFTYDSNDRIIIYKD